MEKRGKVGLTANARAAPPTSRRLEAGHKERERLPIKANLGQKLTRLASSAHR